MKYLVFSISSFSAVNHCFFFFFLSQATTDFGNHRNPGHYFNARKVLCETFIVKKKTYSWFDFTFMSIHVLVLPKKEKVIKKAYPQKWKYIVFL